MVKALLKACIVFLYSEFSQLLLFISLADDDLLKYGYDETSVGFHSREKMKLGSVTNTMPKLTFLFSRRAILAAKQFWRYWVS